MGNRALIAYFVILALLCAGFVLGARAIGQPGVYLAGPYMLTPALAALITRLAFYKPRFLDANLRLGHLRDYFKFWLWSICITLLSFAAYTVFGSIRWDFSGTVFLNALAQQFALQGQNMYTSLPQGLTPQIMLWLYFVGGLSVFNLLPGLLSGFGEEFGHRGFMFPLLLRGKPVPGLVIGGSLWYAWHLPLLLILPPAAPEPLWKLLIDQGGALIGATSTHTYLCYVYAKSRSIFVPSVAHIAMNNAARSFSYFVVLENQFTGNITQYVVMILVIVFLYWRKELAAVPVFLAEDGHHAATSSRSRTGLG